MIKKFSASLMAALAILSSCSSEEPMTAPADGNVNFTAVLPSQMMTRSSFDNGEKATKLQYAVYDSENNNISALNGTKDLVNLSTNVSLNLVTGKTYTVVFWAQAEGAPYSFQPSTGKMTVTPTGDAQDKNRDAFFAFETFTVTGAINKTVELRRPFAQINIGVSDLTDFTTANGHISTSGITVTAPTVLNLIDGSVAPESEMEYVLAPAEFPDEAELFPVATTPAQRWLTTAFVLTGVNKTTVNVTWTSDNDTPGRNAVEYTFVPIQRNYRTNIFGRLLTNPADYTVKIDPEFAEFDYNNGEVNASFVENFDQLKSVLENGGNAILKNDIEVSEPLVVNGASTIDLNGRNLTFETASQNASCFSVGSGKELKMVNGAVNCNGAYAAFNVEGGNLTLNRVNVTSSAANENYGVYLDNSSTTGALNIDKCNISSSDCAVAVKSAANLTYPANYALITNTNLHGVNSAFWLREYDAATQYAKLLSLYIHNRNNTFTITGSSPSAIKFGSDNPSYDLVSDSNDGIYTLHDGKVSLRQYYGDETEVVVPATCNGFPVAEIGYRVFNESSMTSVSLPSSIEVIGDRAFRRCKSLATVELPQGLKKIESNAFQSSGLTSIVIPNSVTEIGPGAFYESTGLTSITLPIDLAITSIPQDAFRELAITEINIPATVTSIGSQAFRNNRQMAKINFGGTKAQWNSINKASNWAQITSGSSCDLQIVCTDGSLLLTGPRTGAPVEM